MILSKSPHYLNITLDFSTTYSVGLDLFIWSGDKANVPLTPTYSLTKERPSIEVSQLDIEISDLVNDYIETKPELQTATGKYNTLSGNGVWVKSVITFNDDVQTITPVEQITFAVAGYGFYLEGINPQAEGALTSSKIQKVDDLILFPYLADGTIAQLEVSDGVTTQTYGLTNENDSNARIGYLWVDTGDFTETFITVTDSVNEWVYEVITECKYTPEKVLYLNKNGAFDLFTFFKAKKEKTSIDSEKFNNAFVSNGSYDTTRHQFKKLNVTAKDKFTLNTDYVSEDENVRVMELLTSDTVYLIQDNTLVPVNVDTTSLDLKTRINDKLISYSLDFEYAFNKINNV